MPQKRVSQETKDRIVFMYQWEKDLTLEEIANINNVSMPTINKIISQLKKDGTLKRQRRSKRSMPNATEEQIMHEYYVLDKPKCYLCDKYKIYPPEFVKLIHKWQDKYPPKKKGRRYKNPPTKQ